MIQIKSFFKLIFVVAITSHAYADESAFEKIQKMNRRRPEAQKNLEEILRAFDSNWKSYTEAHKEELLRLRAQLGYTPLAKEIIDWEENAGRESPIRLDPDYCKVPAVYRKFLEADRFLVKCVSKTNQDSEACLNVSVNLFGQNLTTDKTINNALNEAPATFRCTKI